MAFRNVVGLHCRIFSLSYHQSEIDISYSMLFQTTEVPPNNYSMAPHFIEEMSRSWNKCHFLREAFSSIMLLLSLFPLSLLQFLCSIYHYFILYYVIICLDCVPPTKQAQVGHELCFIQLYLLCLGNNLAGTYKVT